MSNAHAADPTTSSPSPVEESASRSGIARAAGLIGLGNIASRVLGLVREMVIATQFGTGPLTAAFTIASQVPTTIYDLLIGGLLSSALVPVFSEYATRQDNNTSLWRLASIVLSLTTLLLSLLTAIILIFAPQVTVLFASGFDPELRAATTLLLRLIAPSILFFGLSGVLTGLLYALKRFAFVAFAPAIFNLGIITGALVLSRAFEGNARIIGLALGLFLGSVLQLLLLLPDLRMVQLRRQLGAFWEEPGLRRILTLYVPIALSVVIANIGVIVDRNLASNTGVPQTIPWMRNATTLIQFPLGLVAAAISLAILPSLSRLAATEDWPGYRRTLQMGLRMVLVLIIPATIGLFVLAEPIVRLLFERGAFLPEDTYWTALALRFYLLGLIFAAIDQLLIIAFYSRQDTWTPALVGIFTVGVYLVVALPLVGPFKMLGLVLANSVQHFAHAVVMLYLLQRRLGGLTGGGMRRMVPCTLLAALGMGVMVWATSFIGAPLLPATLVGQVAAVVLPGIVGLGSYALLTTILRIEEAQEIARLLLRRAR
ncbi:MAG: murein biosynthesis integral membrane protein MurJ [Ardenticatenales bacterium]|nr:murein biosynthesis integral membrane protein MurJ [Ardenticatenales bacterium]